MFICPDCGNTLDRFGVCLDCGFFDQGKSIKEMSKFQKLKSRRKKNEVAKGNKPIRKKDKTYF